MPIAQWSCNDKAMEIRKRQSRMQIRLEKIKTKGIALQKVVNNWAEVGAVKTTTQGIEWVMDEVFIWLIQD